MNHRKLLGLVFVFNNGIIREHRLLEALKAWSRYVFVAPLVPVCKVIVQYFGDGVLGNIVYLWVT